MSSGGLLFLLSLSAKKGRRLRQQHPGKHQHTAHDLPPGKHHVTIEILSDKNPQSTGHEYRVLGLGAAGVASPQR